MSVQMQMHHICEKNIFRILLHAVSKSENI